MKTFILVGDDQVPASPRDVLAVVQDKGFKAAGQHFGYSESTLRKFLADNHYVAVKQVKFEKQKYDAGLDKMVPVESVARAYEEELAVAVEQAQADPVSGE